MECPRCKRKMSAEEFYSLLKNHADTNLPSSFSSYYVLNNHHEFHDRIVSLIKSKKQFSFFSKDHHKKKKINRPVLLRSSTHVTNNEEYCDGCHRTDTSLIQMKMDQVIKDQQITFWVVTPPQTTRMVDGTIYMIVRDRFDYHVRLVISNWSYTFLTNESKSSDALSDIVNELLPVDSMIKIFDPFLTICSIDNEPTLYCDAPNMKLILIDRIKKCFVLDKLDYLRDRGNQAYICGDTHLAIDYYTFAIQRIMTMGAIVISKDDDCELNLFQNAFQRDLARLHSNRSACYLRERLYPGANLDSLIVVTGRLCNKTYDEFFIKCLYRLICANIGLEEFTFALDEMFNLIDYSLINPNLHGTYSTDFHQLQFNLPRLKEEHKQGKYHLKQMFNQQSIDPTTFFDIHRIHSNFQNHFYIKKRNYNFYSKCSIPAGTLLVARNAFAYIKSGDNDERRLINEVEKHLIMSPTGFEFDLIRVIPCINQWFENETDADEDDYETYPKSFPWGLLVQAQQENSYRSKSLVGWWPNASRFKREESSKKNGNCLWFICGQMIFIFNFVPLNKNEQLIIANDKKISSFLNENQKEFTFLLGKKGKFPLKDIFDELQKTQNYFDT